MAKNENEKHDHKWTKLLKVVIFACMMLAPLFAIAVKCAYITFNKNAKDSYYGETINERIETQTNIETLNIGNKYKIVTNAPFSDFTEIRFSIKAQNNKFIYNGVEKDADYMTFYIQNGTIPYFYLYYNSDAHDYVNINTSSFSCEFILESINIQTNSNNIIKNDIYEITYNNYSYLDNVFYYAVDQMKDNELFNWTKNTAIYNGVNAVTTGLGITTDAIPILLVYWILLTLIYVIFDIVIETFTWLTHLFSNKVIK